jgi:hypothetical protein
VSSTRPSRNAPHLPHHRRVGLGVGGADAGRRAAAHVVPQAGLLAHLHRRAAVLTQGEDRADQLLHAPHHPRVGVRPEVLRAVLQHPTGELQPREGLVRELEEGVRLVVLEQHVVVRLVALDEVRLEDQRLDLVLRDDVLEPLGVAGDQPRLRPRVAPEVRAHPRAQVDRLADVDHGAPRAAVAAVHGRAAVGAVAAAPRSVPSPAAPRSVPSPAARARARATGSSRAVSAGRGGRRASPRQRTRGWGRGVWWGLLRLRCKRPHHTPRPHPSVGTMQRPADRGHPDRGRHRPASDGHAARRDRALRLVRRSQVNALLYPVLIWPVLGLKVPNAP